MSNARLQVLLEFKTDQYFVMPDGGGWAIIKALMKNIEKYDNCDIHWETEGQSLLTDQRGRITGLQVPPIRRYLGRLVCSRRDAR